MSASRNSIRQPKRASNFSGCHGQDRAGCVLREDRDDADPRGDRLLLQARDAIGRPALCVEQDGFDGGFVPSHPDSITGIADHPDWHLVRRRHLAVLELHPLLPSVVHLVELSLKWDIPLTRRQRLHELVAKDMTSGQLSWLSAEDAMTAACHALSSPHAKSLGSRLTENHEPENFHRVLAN